jgi:hypothetical protein
LPTRFRTGGCITCDLSRVEAERLAVEAAPQCGIARSEAALGGCQPTSREAALYFVVHILRID